MDSTWNVVVEEKQAANPCPSSTDDDHAGGGGGDDLISCLCDDVLLRILGQLGALSRRWRGLWARGVPALLFNSDLRFESPRVAERFIAFVDGVLALRARSDCGIDRVEILLRLHYGHGEPHVAPSCARAVERWILYAVQHALTSFVFQVRVIPKKWLDEQEGIVIYNGGGGDGDGRGGARRPSRRAPPLGDGDDEENEVMLVEDDRFAMMEEEDNYSNGDGDGDEAMDNQNGDECDSYKELPVTTTVIALDGDGDGEENEMVLAEWTDDDDDDDDGSDEEVMPAPPVTISLDELPSSTKLETMRLFLGGARVQLPSTAAFTSLTDLALECMEIAASAAGGGNLLARLLSTASCPRLQKLRLWSVQLAAEMTELLLLESDTLTELTMEGVDKLKSLELRTPNLLGLVIQECDDLETVTVSAPKLKELACAYDPSLVAIHGDLPPCLSRLKVDLCSHDYSDDDILDDTSIDLLRRCTSAKSLVVFLYIPTVRGISSWVDLTKDKIPKLPHVTSLEIHVHHMCERHSTGDGASSLLTRFSNLRHLVLQLDELEGCTKTDSMCPESGDDSYYVCDHPDDWSCQEISLAYLEEAEFRGLTGTDCELRFLQGVLASAVNLQKVIVRFSANYRLEDRRDDFILMMLGAAGTWTAYYDAYDQPYYEWRLSI